MHPLTGLQKQTPLSKETENPLKIPLYLSAVALTAVGFAAIVPALFAKQPAAKTTPGSLHIRGTVQSLQKNVLTVNGPSGPVRVQLGAKTPVLSVIPSSRDQVKPGAFLGIASAPGPNGTEQAREVVVFPEAARGTGEGSYPWDLPGGGASKMTNGTVNKSRMTNGTVSQSKMTNGTVAAPGRSKMTNGTVKSGASASEITLEFKQGSGKGAQKLTLPASIPFVTFAPGKPAQLTAGAHVVVFAHSGAGNTTVADRVLVGKNGLVPPM